MNPFKGTVTLRFGDQVVTVRPLAPRRRREWVVWARNLLHWWDSMLAQEGNVRKDMTAREYFDRTLSVLNSPDYRCDADNLLEILHDHSPHVLTYPLMRSGTAGQLVRAFAAVWQMETHERNIVERAAIAVMDYFIRITRTATERLRTWRKRPRKGRS